MHQLTHRSSKHIRAMQYAVWGLKKLCHPRCLGTVWHRVEARSTKAANDNFQIQGQSRRRRLGVRNEALQAKAESQTMRAVASLANEAANHSMCGRSESKRRVYAARGKSIREEAPSPAPTAGSGHKSRLLDAQANVWDADGDKSQKSYGKLESAYARKPHRDATADPRLVHPTRSSRACCARDHPVNVNEARAADADSCMDSRARQ
ncbi:hypothetical protein B0H10DRAFT_1939068 [Mycena sp. CBHHK59/15]|nr:hypothetical protein B0H10DRAFT_1939068 [Mycena sp. CBHHK59/15]